MTHPTRTRYAVEIPAGPLWRVGFSGYGDPALPELDMLTIRHIGQDAARFEMPYQQKDALIAGLQELRRVVSEGQEARQ